MFRKSMLFISMCAVCCLIPIITFVAGGVGIGTALTGNYIEFLLCSAIVLLIAGYLCYAKKKGETKCCHTKTPWCDSKNEA